MTNTRRLRHVIALAAVVGLTTGLAACGTAKKPDAEATLSSDPVTIRIAWWGGDARHSATQKAIDAFEAEHPNITVEAEYSDWTGYWDKLATSTAGKNSPDVLQMDQLYLASYGDRGLLADLGALPQLKTDELDRSVLDTGDVGDTLMAYPIAGTVSAVLVNQDLIHSLGLTLPDTETWTWKDFAAFAAEITEKSGGEVYGTQPMNNEYSLRLYARQHDDELFTDKGITIDPKTLAGYFQQSVDWVEDGASPNAQVYSESAALPLDQSLFATQKQAMLWANGPQVVDYVNATGGANIVPRKLPTDDENATDYTYVKPGMYWSVSSQSAHPAESALLIDYLTNTVEASKILTNTRGIPANPVVRDALVPTLAEGDRIAAEYLDEMESHLGSAPVIVPNGASETDKIIQRYLLEVLFGRQTPEDAAAAMIAEIQASIDAAD